jgi:transposase
MDSKIEQRVCIKFCVKLGKSATKTLEMLCEAFGEHSLSRVVVFQWHSRFKAGQVSVEDDERSGRPSNSKMTENAEKIRELIHEDHCRTIHELADTVGMGQLWSLPGDLNRKFEHAPHCREVCSPLLDK